jgi:hypothetical protein
MRGLFRARLLRIGDLGPAQGEQKTPVKPSPVARVRRSGLAFLSLLALALPSAGIAGTNSPARHGAQAVMATVCDRLVKIQLVAGSTQIVSLEGRLGSRRLHYWNESPNTSYLYGLATFVELRLVGRTLYIRAVRVIPICAPLRIVVSW